MGRDLMSIKICPAIRHNSLNLRTKRGQQMVDGDDRNDVGRTYGREYALTNFACFAKVWRQQVRKQYLRWIFG